jgi:hypothetical protein
VDVLVRQHAPGVVVPDVHRHTETDLLLIANALNVFGLLLGLGQGREQHRGQNRNDGDHHQQFDQGKAPHKPAE